MTTAKDIATQTGALCVGATAFALGDPSGGTLLAMPLTGLAAIGITLKSGCADRAAAKAQKAVLKVLADHPEYDAALLTRAKALLDELPTLAQIDPKALARASHGDDLEQVVCDQIVGALGIEDEDPLNGLMATVVLAGLAACKSDETFRANLTLEMVIEIGRQQGHQMVLAQDTNARVGALQAGQDDTHAMLRELLARTGGFESAMADPDTLSLSDLQALAAKFGETDGRDRPALVEFLTKKAEEYRAYRAEIEGIDERTKGLGNLKAAAREAAERLDFEEVEALLSRVQEVELEIAAETAELRAGNALLRGRVEQAYRLYAAAADSFAAVDPLEPARRRDRYRSPLYRHGLRYGGPGLMRAIELVKPVLSPDLKSTEAALYAGIQNNLGLAFQNQGTRTGGAEGTALLAEAVSAYRDALTVYTRDEHPVHWAMTQNNLGNALRNQGTRTGGAEGTALLAEAVSAYRDALTVRTRDDHPVDWAMTQNNIAIALRNQGTRTGGAEGTALLAEAVTAYRDALTVYTRDDHPVQWAMTQNNLGNALAEQGTRSGGAEGTALLAEAVSAYRDALTVYTRDAHPVDWAMTQNNIAIALQTQGTRTGGAEGTALLAEAVTAYRDALTVYTRDDHPVHWAMTLENMAIAEKAIAKHAATGDPRRHLEAALEYVEASLEVFDPEHMPYNFEKASHLRDEIRAALDGG